MTAGARTAAADSRGATMFDRFREECGVVGIYGHPEASNLVYLSLYALQHRGQEAAGIVSARGEALIAHRSLGLVADVFNEEIIRKLGGNAAIGHNRYSTSGQTLLKNTQPLIVEYGHGPLAVAHNGNLVNAAELRLRLQEQGSIFQSTVDTEVIVHLIAASRGERTIDRVISALAEVRGAYSLVFLTPHELIAARDHQKQRGRRFGDLRSRSDRRRVRARTRAGGGAAGVGRGRGKLPTVSGSAAHELHLRVHLLRAPRQPCLRPQRL
jgi:amidophosphoribosyltransferase